MKKRELFYMNILMLFDTKREQNVIQYKKLFKPALKRAQLQTSS